MKMILAISGAVFLAILVLGFLFVQWANRPENVEALQKKRETEAARKIEDEKKQAVQDKEIEAKKARLKLVIDENFAGNRFDFLDYKFDYSFFRFEKNEFTYSGTLYKGVSPQQFFIFSKEDFGDFAAEMDFRIWGRDALAGIFWDAQPNGERNPVKYQSATSTPNGLSVNAGKESEDFNLGSFFESATSQKMRVEKFGNSLKVSINGQMLFDKTIESDGENKVGIFLGHRGGLNDGSQSLSIYVKTFRVWK